MAREGRYADGYWWSADGVRLHYRDYPGHDAALPPILCLPGLTRNARDFEGVAEALSPEWRVIAVDLRGRGDSGWAKDPMSYVPLTYLQDIGALLDELAITRVVLFGTSLGGLLSMLLSATRPGQVAGVLLNDVGPVLEADGLARIRTYVGRGGSWPTWLHAARALAESQRASYPDYALEDWLRLAKRLCRLTPAGRVVFDYDMKIAEPFRTPAAEGAGFDLWPAFETLAAVPGLLLRGVLSDILSAATAAEMVRRAPAMERVDVANVGHAPTLDEPDARAGIARLLARVAGATPA